MTTDDPQRADDRVAALQQRRIDDFVIRARRVEAHSLASDRDRLAELSNGPLTFLVQGGRVVGVRQKFPPEEVVESAAARVRPILLAKEHCHLPSVLNAIKYFDRGADVKDWTKRVLDQWNRRTNEGIADREPGMRVMVHNATTGESGTMDELQLAMAWIYGDVVHHYPERRDGARIFGLRERYSAAVPLVAFVMATTIVVLEGIRDLHSADRLNVGEGALTERVALETTTFEMPATGYFAEVGAAAPGDAREAPSSEWSESVPGFPPASGNADVAP